MFDNGELEPGPRERPKLWISINLLWLFAALKRLWKGESSE